MLSEKLPININFAQGVDTKTDPKQLQIGKFVSLVNSRFTKAGLLEKRDGYPELSSSPNTSAKYLTTFNGNLTSIGSELQAYSPATSQWVDKGGFTPISFSTIPVVRSALSQIQSDSVVSSSGLVCTAYTEKNNSTKYYKYVIQDAATGQNIAGPTSLAGSSGSVAKSPRVFLLGGYFIVAYGVDISGTIHLQYIAISTNDPAHVSAPADIAADYNDSGLGSWDGVVVDNKLFVAYSTSAGGTQIQVTSLSTGFVVAAPTSFASQACNLMGLCADTSGASAAIYFAWHLAATPITKCAAFDTNLNKLMTPTTIDAALYLNNITGTAQGGVLTVAYEVNNHYSYDSNINSNYLNKVAVTLPASVTTGTVGSTTAFIRSVGLASKAFLLSGTMYVLSAYDGASTSVQAYQPTYFMTDISGNIISRIAYQNGGGYLSYGLPQGQVVDDQVFISYLFRDLIQPVNKTQGAASSTGVYTQTGVNLGTFGFDSDTIFSSEIGNNLNLSAGMQWAYDGNLLSEQGFNLYPDSVQLTQSTSGGSMTTQDYFYQVMYQWTDAQGNIINSAPSIPVKAASGSFSGSSNKVTLNFPTLRLSYKTGVKILIFRWSTAQPSYYQVTSIAAPTLNDPTTDSISYQDTLADASIIGNSIIYTAGGVLENTPGPACTDVTLFDTRVWSISAEDQNLLNYSKQVIESVPVEMSDFLTFYVAPNAGTSASTGPMKCLFPMDDKIIIFKKNAIFYINGTGPDNTGANSQYSQPIFITSTVGCVNKKSIVLTGMGLMFQSDKGIWLLDRNLGTEYVGAPVEAFNGYTVTSANALPETTMIVFSLEDGPMLMYDYFFNQWQTWEGINAISSCIFEDRHTTLTSGGMVSQQTPEVYLDNGNPVLQSFTTGWINIAKLMGFQRFYGFAFVGQYFSPHLLTVSLSYNYVDTTVQNFTIRPNNFSAVDPSPFGDQPSPFGSPTDLEQWQLSPQFQKCQAFQISVQESYDSTKGVPAGAGFSISGLNMIARVKRTSRPLRATQTVG